ncbi:MAG: tetratricopeptide repeat protein [Thiogranum sp.]
MAALKKLKKRANEYLENNELIQARKLFGKIVRMAPQDIEAWLALAGVSWMMHDYEDAEAGCRRALRINPRLPGAWLNLGSALAAQGKHAEAADSYRRMIAVKPDAVIAYQSLGNTLRKMDAHAEAVEVFGRGLELQPRHAGIHYDLGNTFKARGEMARAVACFRQALRLQPDYLLAHSNLIACMLYDESSDPQKLFEEQVKWGKSVEGNVPPVQLPGNDPDPDRKLRVGYCSPDFRKHSVAFFFESLLECHDRAEIEAVCYSETDKPDATTQRLRLLAGQWRDTCGMSNEDVYGMIRADRIDVLVDLAGLTQGNRLEVFARRAAPVQVNYLGYASSTGLASMDYRLTDAWADPVGIADCYHTEKLVRLPHGFLCYRPLVDAPAVSGLPARRAGHITFGSFNNLAKVTPEVVSLWADVLKAVPDSRLICKAQRLGDASIRRYYADLFAAQGIARERVELVGRLESSAEHLALYGRVDIGLDTFPYNGTTTTCEALWMGVPVVVLEGGCHLARVGLSILHQLGLEQCIARDKDDFISVAAGLGRNLDDLAGLRAALRSRMPDSPLCDATAFTRDIENAFRQMWKDWCALQ